MAKSLNTQKKELIDKLEEVSYELSKEDKESLDSGLSMAKSITKLAGISHEKEYMLIKNSADKLLVNTPSFEENE